MARQAPARIFEDATRRAALPEGGMWDVRHDVGIPPEYAKWQGERHTAVSALHNRCPPVGRVDPIQRSESTVSFFATELKQTPRNGVFIEKSPVAQSLKNFPRFYGSLRFTTMFTRALHWSLS
jgi:hypothetical protein